MKDEVKNLELLQGIEAFYTGGSVLWSGDGRTVFTVCGNIVKTLDVEKGVPECIIGNDVEQSDITCAVLSANSTKLTVAYANSLVCSYTISPLLSSNKLNAELNQRWRSTHHGPILVMNYSADGILLATGSADFSVWQVEMQNCIGSLKGSSTVSQIAFSDAERILVGYNEGSVCFFELKKEKKLIHKWKNHTSQIVTILFPDKKIAWFLSRDQTISSVSLETYEKLKILPVFEPVECGTLVGQDLYTVGEEGVLKCWQNGGAKLVRSAKISKCRIDRILHNEACHRFLLVCCDFNLYLVDEKSFAVVRQYVGFNDEIFDTAFVGEELKSLIVATNSPDIRIYDTQTWSCQLFAGHSDSILSLSTAQWDQNLFASSSKDNSIILWKIKGNNEMVVEKVAVATGHTNNVTSVKISNSSSNPFILSVSHDTSLKLWSLAGLSGKKCSKLSASSTLVAHSKDISCLDISVNDRLCVTGSMDKTAKLWHIDSKAMQLGIAGTLSGHRRGIWDAKFCDLSQVICTCSGDCIVRVFSLSSLDCVAALNGHSFAVLQVVFINNGRQLMSADSGGLLKIWNLTTKECVATIEAHDDKIWALRAMDDESKFVTAGSDGRVKIWEDVTEKKREEEGRLQAKKTRDDQTLANLMEQLRFSEAFAFTLTLDKPYNCLKVVSALLEDGGADLSDSIATLVDDQLVVFLNFISQWNTNSRTSTVAQKVLYEVLHTIPPSKLLKLHNFAAVLESLIPYTKRHLERMSHLHENASFVDFVWSQMRLPDVRNV